MAKPGQKDTVKARELVLEPKKAYHEKNEPIRFKLKRSRVVSMDDNLKRIYGIKN